MSESPSQRKVWFGLDRLTAIDYCLVCRRERPNDTNKENNKMVPDLLMPCECSEEDTYSEVISARSDLDAAGAQLSEALRLYGEAEEAHNEAMAHWISAR